MPRHRLGVVLVLPDPVATEIDGLRRACADPSLELVPTHITLVPPVNVNATNLAGAIEVLRSAAAATEPLRLSVGPAATFLPDTPVLYLAVSGDFAELARLRDRVSRGPLEPTSEVAVRAARDAG